MSERKQFGFFNPQDKLTRLEYNTQALNKRDARNILKMLLRNYRLMVDISYADDLSTISPTSDINDELSTARLSSPRKKVQFIRDMVPLILRAEEVIVWDGGLRSAYITNPNGREASRIIRRASNNPNIELTHFQRNPKTNIPEYYTLNPHDVIVGLQTKRKSLRRAIRKGKGGREKAITAIEEYC